MAYLRIVVVCVLVAVCNGLVVYPDYKNHTCKRTCDGRTTTCQYDFTYEYMFTMEPDCGNCLNGTVADCSRPTCVVADGRSRMFNAINRMLHGPAIEVCQGDRIVVDVHNELGETSTTVHWHGIHQTDTPWMDGVPFITQCPINPFTTFRYNFIATESGTHWYHSHTGFQRVNGAFGPLIVRTPKAQNPHSDRYDRDLSEHVITLAEWSRELAEIHYYRANRMKIIDQFLTAILVSGIGTNRTIMDVPPKNFTVEKGTRYRFRVIHAGALVCPIELKIDGHRMTLISTDGYDIDPITVDRFVINNGERLDFILNANQDTMQYAMTWQGLIDCERIQGYSVLNYQGAKVPYRARPSNTPDLVFNCINVPNNQPNCVSYNDVRSVERIDADMRRNPDWKYFFGMDTLDYALPVFRGVGDAALTATHVNNITFFPPATPLIQSTNGANICNLENRQNCERGEQICICTHLLRIPRNSLVELILIDEGSTYDLSHPFHVHGTNFRVIGQDKLGNSTTAFDVRNLDRQNRLVRNYDRPALKDTVGMPDGGYVIIRFYATNPGFWFFHCHVEHHIEEGMGLVLQVGSAPTLPNNFPRCGNYYG